MAAVESNSKDANVFAVAEMPSDVRALLIFSARALTDKDPGIAISLFTKLSDVVKLSVCAEIWLSAGFC